nr:hypothetical protein [Tanacetum cinerariifolium]
MDQLVPNDASFIALSPGYIADFDPKEDLKEDPEEDPADYPIPLPPLPIPSLPLPLPPPTTSPIYVEALVCYKAVRIRLRVASPSTHHPSEIPSPPLLLPSTSHRDDTPKADMPLWKRARFTTPAFGFEVEESSAAAVARHQVLDVTTMDANPRSLVSREVGYEIEDVWDDMVEDIEERAQTTVELEQKSNRPFHYSCSGYS